MDVYGFHIMTEKAWNFFLELVNNNANHFENEYTIGIGSNQEIRYKDKDDLLRNFTIKEISQEYSDQTKKNI